MTDTPISLSSADIRSIIATLDRKVEAASVALLRAEDAYAAEVRNSALSGAPCDRSAMLSGIERARTALAVERDTLAEAQRQLDAALAREAAAARAVAQDEVRQILAKLATAADEADASLATYIGRYETARKLEKDAQRICRERLDQELFGTQLQYSLAEAARHLESLRGGNPTEIEGWAARWAAKATTDISRAAKL